MHGKLLVWALSSVLACVGAGCGGDDDDQAQAAAACKLDDPTTCGKGTICVAQGGANVCVTGCQQNVSDSCDAGLVCEEISGAISQCFAPIEIRGKVIDALASTGIAAARVAARDDSGAITQKIATSTDDGSYTVSLSTPRNADGSPVARSVTLRGDAADYASFPGGIRPALPVDLSSAAVSSDAAPTGDHGGKLWVVENALTTIALLPLPSTANLGTIRGKVDSTDPGGTLVTAGGSTAIADVDGEFVIFNVPAGAASVHGYAAGVQLAPVDVTVTADAEIKDVVLKPSTTALATVSGNLNVVNAGGLSSTSVVLVVEETFIEALEVGEVPKGLRADNATGSFSIAGVPDGKYVVLASLDNDGLVRDPDTSIAGTDLVHIDVKNGAPQSGLSFKVTGALGVVSPGADGPEEVAGTPTFVWKDDSSEDGYELRVFDAFGDKVWEDLAVPSVKGNKNVEVTYAGPALKKGMYYQFRATSMKAGVPISRTEQLRGVFSSKLRSHATRRYWFAGAPPSMNRTLLTVAFAGFALGVIGCGGSDDSSTGTTSPYPYTPGTAVVRGPDGDAVVGADSNGCISTSNGTCVKLDDKCGKGKNAAEIIVDKDGNVLAVVCFPTDGVTVDPVAQPAVDDLTGGNNSVIVLDGAADGPDVTGDVTLSGNNLTLYGQGPDVSEIGGDLTISQNNAVVYGLTVDGSVTFEQNGGSLSYCVVKGDVILGHNGALVAGCDIWGKVVVRGNNNILVNNRIAGGVELAGGNLTCDGNVSFADANGDKVIQDSEVGGAISCGQ